MSRFLFVCVPLPGHAHPMAALAHAVIEGGGEVVWAGSESFLRPFVGSEATIHPIPLRAHRGQADRGMAATKSRWAGYIVPHARSTRAGLQAAVEQHAPDVLVVDQHAIGGAVEAHRAGLPWATVAPTTMELTRPLRVLPKVEQWIGEQMSQIWAEAGMPGQPPHDLRFSPHLVVAFTSAALTGTADVPPQAQLVGPALTNRPSDPAFPWDWLDPRREHVLVTVGTLAMDLATVFYQRVVQALEPLGERLQAVVVAPDQVITDPPAHILVRPQAPVLELMPHLQAVVSHGGLNTVCEALWHGVPLLIAPIKSDQAVNAGQVAAAGAGIRVAFDRVRPQALRSGLLSLLEDPSYGKAAAHVGAAFAAAGGACAGATALHQLATRASTSPPTPTEPAPHRESEQST